MNKTKLLIFIIILTIFLGCKSENKASDLGKTAKTESKSDSFIIGKWKVISSTVLPFEHISHCNKLKLNSVFEFKTNRTLTVYESPNGETCTKDQMFKVSGMKLEILEWDMLFDYEIVSLNSDTLKFKIDNLPTYFWTELNPYDEKIQEKLKEINNNGIIVTLTRMKKSS